MTLSEKIEANANLTLWCVHILGPDDVHAAPSYLAAATHAHELNKALHRRLNSPDDILCFAYAAPWPHSAESHAENLKTWLQGEPGQDRLATVIADTFTPTKTPARPLDEWHEDMGDVVWWALDEHGEWLGEPAYIGSPLDLGKNIRVTVDGNDFVCSVAGWPGYHTHFTPHPAAPDMPVATLDTEMKVFAQAHDCEFCARGEHPDTATVDGPAHSVIGRDKAWILCKRLVNEKKP